LDVSSYPSDTEVPYFRLRMKCSKCGGRNVDVRPNWKEQPPTESLTSKSIPAAARRPVQCPDALGEPHYRLRAFLPRDTASELITAACWRVRINQGLISARLLKVRFSPESDNKADIHAGRSRAKRKRSTSDPR
jgi:hypothetical protein